MTENEALEELKTFPISCLDFKENQALDMAIKALEEKTMLNEIMHELSEYQAIGTVEEITKLINFLSCDDDTSIIEDLQMLAEYHSIGTIEEFQALKEKSVAKVIELPCELNDTVFCILERRTRCTENDQEFDEYACQGCECLECDSVKEKYISEQKAYTLEWIVSNRRKFGKTIFLTKEEAEKKLTNKT